MAALFDSSIDTTTFTSGNVRILIEPAIGSYANPVTISCTKAGSRS